MSRLTSKCFDDKNIYNSFEVYSREKNSSSIVNDIQQLTKVSEKKEVL